MPIVAGGLTHRSIELITPAPPFRTCFMRVDQIPVGKNAPDDVNVIIEVPIGGEPIKY